MKGEGLVEGEGNGGIEREENVVEGDRWRERKIRRERLREEGRQKGIM